MYWNLLKYKYIYSYFTTIITRAGTPGSSTYLYQFREGGSATRQFFKNWFWAVSKKSMGSVCASVRAP